MKKIVIATNNKGKIKEIKEILKNVKLLTLKEIKCDVDVVEDRDTFKGNALKKAKEINELTKYPCIADDSGLCIEKFDGWPGVHTARFLGEGKTDVDRNSHIIDKMKELKGEERKASVVCVIVYYENGEEIITEGIIEGKISEEIRGINGFGFDSIFELENGKTLAELVDEEKNMLSSRKIALEKLQKILTNR